MEDIAQIERAITEAESPIEDPWGAYDELDEVIDYEAFGMDLYPLDGGYSEMLSTKHKRLTEFMFDSKMVVNVNGEVYIFDISRGIWSSFNTSEGLRAICDLLDLSNVSVNYKAAVAPFENFIERYCLRSSIKVAPSVNMGRYRYFYEVPAKYMPNLASYRKVLYTMLCFPGFNDTKSMYTPQPGSELHFEFNRRKLAYERVLSGMLFICVEDGEDELDLDYPYDVHEPKIMFKPYYNLINLGKHEWSDDTVSTLCIKSLYGSLTFRNRFLNLGFGRVEKFMSASLEICSLRLLMWALGNAISDPVYKPKIIYLYGTGGNGKTVLANLIYSLFRGVIAPLTKDYLGTSGESVKEVAEEDAVNLLEQRMVLNPECRLTKGKLNSYTLRVFTGNDTINAHGVKGKASSTILASSNELWFPSPATLEDSFTRRMLLIEMTKLKMQETNDAKLLDMVPPYEQSYFIAKCLYIRTIFDHPPITPRLALLTILGKRAGVCTRAIVFRDGETLTHRLAATYSVAAMAEMTPSKLLSLVTAMSPNLVESFGGHRYIRGISLAVCYQGQEINDDWV